MRRIELDGSGWQSRRDFYDALATALGSVGWHGRNADAFLETMVYHCDLNSVQPPYEVVIENAPDALRPFLCDFSSWVMEARRDRRDDPGWGGDVQVAVTVA